MSIEFATAAAFQQSKPRRLTLVQAPAVAQPVVRSATRKADFTDCVEFAFGGLVMVGVLLFAAGLLRFCAIDGQVAAGLQFAVRTLYALAAFTGGAVAYGVGRGIRRQLRG
jgi:hypothetical protein